jgi:hypothetical protein
MQRFGVRVKAICLPKPWIIPTKAIGLQRAQDEAFGAGDRAFRIYILDTEQPSPSRRTGVEITANGGDQRSEMQRASGRGGKATDIAVFGRGACGV